MRLSIDGVCTKLLTLTKGQHHERSGLHARPYWIAPNVSGPDMVGWPLVARGSRGSQPGKNLPHRYEKGCYAEKTISDACHAWRSRILTTIAERWLRTNVPPLIPEWYLRTDGPLFAVRRIEPYH